MPVPQNSWTVERLHELPDDGNRYEVIDGVLLVSPSPAPVHQRAVWELMVILHQYVAALRMEAFFAPAAVTWSESTEVQPDIMVVQIINGRRIERFEEIRDLELAVEVLSPSSVRADRFVKRREYQRKGVAEYWIVDTMSRSFECWRPNDEEPTIVFETLVWHPRPDAAPLWIDLAKYFRAVHGE